jgi:hypothetical protein
MCFRTSPGTPSGPAALWLGVRLSASCMMAGVIWPAIIGIDEVGVARTYPRQGNGAPGGRVGSGESAMVSSSSIFFFTETGSVMRSPVSSSLIMERSVGSVLVFVFPAVVRRRDLRAVFVFFTNSLRRCFPYLARRTLRACLMSARIAWRRPLKQVCTARAVALSAFGLRSSFVRMLRVLRLRGGCERVVRISRVFWTQLQRAG